MPTIINQKLEATNLETRRNGVPVPPWLFPRTRTMVTPVLQRGSNAVQMGRTTNERRSVQAHGL